MNGLQTNQLTTDLSAAMALASRETAQRHGVYVDVEHLLMGVLQHSGGAAADLLRERGVALDTLYQQVAAAVGVERPAPAEVKGLTRSAQAALERAASEAMTLGARRVGTGHVLLSLMAEGDGAVRDVLTSLDLTPEAVRDFVRTHAESKAEASIPLPGSARPARRPGARPAQPDGTPKFVLVPTRPSRQRQTAQPASKLNRTLLWVGIGAALLAYLVFALPQSTILTFVIVLAGWIFSLTLHEFSHAAVAYLGGDHTVREKGYLSFNPLKYTDPLLSIGMPLLFLALGGIGLPGGAVYIERHRLRSKWWGAAVSAAGPAANALLALVLAVPFVLGVYERGSMWWSALAFLTMLQITAVILNLLPVPPLDGFGIIEPFLDHGTRMQLRQFGRFGIFLVFIMLWFFPPAADAFWGMIWDITRTLQIPDYMISEGFWNFMFWRNGS